MTLRKLLREPLLHFFLLGALLFALFAILNRDAMRSPDSIEVDAARIAALRTQFERVWQRPPTAAELDALIDTWIREEMLYREGLALGFETDDPVIRRRVVQKVTFMAETLVDETTTDQELSAWLAEHPDDYRIEPRISLRQVYFDPGRHPEIDAVMAHARQTLEADPAAQPGDTTLLPATIADRSQSDVERTFGRDFASTVFELPPGDWAGPVRSGFGLHLVRVASIEPGRRPALDEVRPAVERDVIAARKRQAEAAFIDALRERYSVVIDREETASSAGAP